MKRTDLSSTPCVLGFVLRAPPPVRPPFNSSHYPVGQGISSTHLIDGETEAQGREGLAKEFPVCEGQEAGPAGFPVRLH